MEWPAFDVRKLTEGLKKYRFALLVLLVGGVLLLWPTDTGRKSDPAPTGEPSEAWCEYELGELENRLAESLSAIQGVGRAEVVLTVRSGSRRILAQNQELGNGSNRTTTVILNAGSGTQEAVTTQILSPVFQGALVVCDGGGSSAVRLDVIHAVSALTGLGADKISVSQRAGD